MSKEKITFPKKSIELIAEKAHSKVDYERIKKDVLAEISQPQDGKDGKDLLFTEAIKADVVDAIIKLIPKPQDGKDGKDGRSYELSDQARADIAQEAINQLSLSKQSQNAIIEEIIKRALFVTKTRFNEQMKSFETIINQSKKGGAFAGISGAEMVAEIDKAIGRDWKTSGSAGHQAGFVVKYKTATFVTITGGSYESDGSIFTLSNEVNQEVSSLASGFDHHYIYLDKSASLATPAAPTFYDETTEPVFDIARNGYYHPTNTKDRLVGEMPSTDGAATLIAGEAIQEGNLISLETAFGRMPNMATNFVTDGAYKTPTNDGSVVTPVNAKNIRFRMQGGEVTAGSSSFASTSEFAAIETNPTNAQVVQELWRFFFTINSMNLGASRNIKIAGAVSDGNFLTCDCVGYKYAR